MNTSVVVVDDAELFRTGLAAALARAGFTVAGEASDAEGAVSLCDRLQPDVVVLDILMPGLSGLDVVEKIRAASPGSKVVMLSASESEEDLLECIRAGARGYLSKDGSFDGLARSLHDVAGGGAALSSRMAGKLLDVLTQLLRHQDFTASRRPALTGREIEVLQHVAQGLTSRDIGDVLFISENTVKNHVRNVLDKLGLHSRNEAVLYAIRENLIAL
ncbi:MAG TPA: response regulator transcription factor [Acidimicrobiia bacterium]|nr:response regulator transcription factor [Acidimicrobiia bacterium]